MTESTRRFRIALSFAGEKRHFVAQLAGRLADTFSEEKILYDKYHEAEFSRSDLAFYLPKLYHDQSDLIVVVLSRDYEKEWCGVEWDAIFDLLKTRKNNEVMLFRFDRETVKGLYSGAGFVDLDDKTTDQAATLILQRLALNEGKPREHYLGRTLAVKLTQIRESIEQARQQIEACFTSTDITADEIERACDLVLDFTKQFGVEDQHRRAAIFYRTYVANLLSRERRGELKPEEFRLEREQLRRDVLALTHAVVHAAESHLPKATALPITTIANPGKNAVSAIIPPSPLRESLIAFLEQQTGNGVVFRAQRLSKRYGIGGPEVIAQLNIELTEGEITGVVGLN
jgi:TIR domain